MKVVHLWNAFNSWAPFTIIDVFENKSGKFHSYIYSEDMLKRYADYAVVSFDYDAENDRIKIEV
jgi:hypothetical protein|nr:MAG TPA: hypothetical protein [Caudoviricetes sp.]